MSALAGVRHLAASALTLSSRPGRAYNQSINLANRRRRQTTTPNTAAKFDMAPSAVNVIYAIRTSHPPAPPLRVPCDRHSKAAAAELGPKAPRSATHLQL